VCMCVCLCVCVYVCVYVHVCVYDWIKNGEMQWDKDYWIDVFANCVKNIHTCCHWCVYVCVCDVCVVYVCVCVCVCVVLETVTRLQSTNGLRHKDYLRYR